MKSTKALRSSILILLGSLFATFSTNAENDTLGSFGFTAGWGYYYTKLVKTGNGYLVPAPRITGYHFGGHIQIPTNLNAHLVTGITYLKGGHKHSGGSEFFGNRAFTAEFAQTDMHYLYVPLLVKYYTGKKIKIYGMFGPAIQYLVSGKLRAENGQFTDNKEMFEMKEQKMEYQMTFTERLGVGINAGVGVEIPFIRDSKLKIEPMYYRHRFAVTQPYSTDPFEFKNYALTITAGITHPIYPD